MVGLCRKDFCMLWKSHFASDLAVCISSPLRALLSCGYRGKCGSCHVFGFERHTCMAHSCTRGSPVQCCVFHYLQCRVLICLTSDWHHTRGTTKRSRQNPEGDVNRESVRLANMILARVCILLTIVSSKGAMWFSCLEPSVVLLHVAPRHA
jgi:hypothetical protein